MSNRNDERQGESRPFTLTQIPHGWSDTAVVKFRLIRNDKCASSEGWHEQWVKVPLG
jgi:hypothetical protein